MKLEDFLEKSRSYTPLHHHGRAEVSLNKESPDSRNVNRGFFVKVAATYSPTGVQYHRRKRA